MKYRIETLGCKVNQYETAALEEILQKAAYEKTEGMADVCIVNTCTVTHAGDRKSRQWISRFKRENPEAIVVVMGCYAQIAHEELKQRPDVDLLIGTQDKDRLPELIEHVKRHGPTDAVQEIPGDALFTELTVGDTHEHTRATLKVQDGCNQFCSYCIIPIARGPVRSRSFSAVKEELARLADAGFREVVLTGIHLASYLDDTKRLIDVIELANDTEGIERIRLSSLEPKIVTDAFADRLRDVEKLCDHFHLSLQSGSDAVLSRMNRKYTTDDYRKSLSRLRDVFPNAGLTTDIICGFPGETQEEWEESLQFAKEADFSRIHVFTYSKRAHTKAALMKEQVPNEVKKQRNAEMTALGHALAADFHRKQIGKKLSVLVEERLPSGCWSGYAKNYVPVHLEGQTAPNQILTVEIVDAAEDYAIGRPVL